MFREGGRLWEVVAREGSTVYLTTVPLTVRLHSANLVCKAILLNTYTPSNPHTSTPLPTFTHVDPLWRKVNNTEDWYRMDTHIT